MNGDLMRAAQDEAIRLLHEQHDLVSDLCQADDLIHGREEDGKGRVLDRERVAEIIEVLDGEADKIARIEFTLAVVGTVGAGKSTAINAIVGTEVLPNRTRPMTALPTVVRHKPNLREPQLTVNIADALDQMATDIAKKLQDGDRLEKVRRSHNDDMKTLIDDLAAGRIPAIGKRQDGRDRAFKTLGRIHDLLRLGRHDAVGVELPIEHHELWEMPSLQVQFRCLADATQQSGTLSLAYIPEFKKARMSQNLSKVLGTQWKKASAVLIILDYTELNIEAPEELEMLIDEVSDIPEERVFVLLNKFDQIGENDTFKDEDALRKHIADDTMKGRVNSEHVYPVSAKHAYLASRALEDLDHRDRLSSPDDEPLVSDRDRNAAKSLWSQSKFDAPLRDVVAAQDRAAKLVFEVALRKLEQHANFVENYLEQSAESLASKIKYLEETIREMKTYSKNITGSKSHLELAAKTVIENISCATEKELKEVPVKTKEAVEADFEKHLQMIAEQTNTYETDPIFRRGTSKSLYGVLDNSLDGEHGLTLGTRLYGSDSTEEKLDRFRRDKRLEYVDKEEYENARELIFRVYSNMAKQFLHSAMSSVQAIVSDANRRIMTDLNASLKKTLDEVCHTLSDTNTEVNFRTLDVMLDCDSVEVFDVEFSGNVESRTEKITVESSPWVECPPWIVPFAVSSLLRSFDLLDADRDSEERSLEIDYYIIDREKIIDEIHKRLSNVAKELNKSIERQVLNWQEEYDKVFKEMQGYLEKMDKLLAKELCERTREHMRAQKMLKSAGKPRMRAKRSRVERNALQEAMKVLFSERATECAWSEGKG